MRHTVTFVPKEADILTPNQKSVICQQLWTSGTLLGPPSPGISQQTFFIQQSNREKVGKFSFANRLNDIVPLLSDAWLDESVKQMKKTSKTLILETVTAKCDI